MFTYVGNSALTSKCPPRQVLQILNLITQNWQKIKRPFRRQQPVNTDVNSFNQTRPHSLQPYLNGVKVRAKGC